MDFWIVFIFCNFSGFRKVCQSQLCLDLSHEFSYIHLGEVVKNIIGHQRLSPLPGSSRKHPAGNIVGLPYLFIHGKTHI